MEFTKEEQAQIEAATYSLPEFAALGETKIEMGLLTPELRAKLRRPYTDRELFGDFGK